MVISGVEYVSTRLSNCNATLRAMTKVKTKFQYRDENLQQQEKEIERTPKSMNVSRQIDESAIVRRLTPDELKNFLEHGVQRSDETNQPHAEGDSNSMAKNTKKTKKSNGGNQKIGGAASYVRELYDSGITKTAAHEKLLAKFPAFSHDQAGWESRWRTAERIAKNNKEKAKEGAKPAKKSAAPARGSKKAPPARKAPASRPPPRPGAIGSRPAAPAPTVVVNVAPAAAEASVAEPEPTKAA